MAHDRWNNDFLDSMRQIGDEEADPIVTELVAKHQIEVVDKLMTTLVKNDDVVKDDIPPELHRFLDKTAALPDWADMALIERGEADFLVSFEKLETLRYLEHLHPAAWVLINDQEVLPLPVSSGKARYPAGVEGAVRKAGLKAKVLNGPELAERAGNRRAVNSVILGFLSRLLSFSEEAWIAALQGHVPPRHLVANMSAFRLGRRRRVG